MEIAVITVVINEADGINYQEIVEAKTIKALETKLKKKLPEIIKNYHLESDHLEEEDDQYLKDVAEDLIDDRGTPYFPSCYTGSGFIQIKFF
jgi:hypothetical protein